MSRRDNEFAVKIVHAQGSSFVVAPSYPHALQAARLNIESSAPCQVTIMDGWRDWVERWDVDADGTVRNHRVKDRFVIPDDLDGWWEKEGSS